MPFYEYQCGDCEHRLEVLQKISDEPLIFCPQCNEASLKKLISVAAFRLKGTGWYETDFKNSNVNKESTENKESNGKKNNTENKESSDAKKSGASDQKAKTKQPANKPSTHALANGGSKSTAPSAT